MKNEIDQTINQNNPINVSINKNKSPKSKKEFRENESQINFHDDMQEGNDGNDMQEMQVNSPLKNNNNPFYKKESHMTEDSNVRNNFNPDENPQFLMTNKSTIFLNNNLKVRNRLKYQQIKSQANHTKNNSKGFMFENQIPGKTTKYNTKETFYKNPTSVNFFKKNLTQKNFRSNSLLNNNYNSHINNSNNNYTKTNFNPQYAKTSTIGLGLPFTNNIVQQELSINNHTGNGRYVLIKPTKHTEPKRKAYTTKYLKDVLVPDNKHSYQHFKSKMKYDNFTITKELKRGLCKDNFEKFYQTNVKPYEMFIPYQVDTEDKDLESDRIHDIASNTHFNNHLLNKSLKKDNKDQSIQAQPSFDGLILSKNNKEEDFFLTKMKKSSSDFLTERLYKTNSEGFIKCKRTENIFNNQNYNEQFREELDLKEDEINQKNLAYKKEKIEDFEENNFESPKEKKNYIQNMKRKKFLEVKEKVFGKCSSVNDEIFKLNQKNVKNEEAILVNHIENDINIIKKLNEAKMYKTDSMFNPFKQLYKLVYKPF